MKLYTWPHRKTWTVFDADGEKVCYDNSTWQGHIQNCIAEIFWLTWGMDVVK